MDYGNRLYGYGAKSTISTAITAFARYAGFVARHFESMVYAYEIRNEWDNKIGYTLPERSAGYMNLLKVAYPMLKNADPDALVLSGSATSRSILGGYLAQLVRMGALHYTDGLSLHPYIQCKRESTVMAWETWVTDIYRQLARLGERPVPVYVSEVDWPSLVGSCEVSLDVQAERAHDVVTAAHALGFVRGNWWYDLLDDGTSRFNPEDNLGSSRATGRPSRRMHSRRGVKSVEH